MNVKSARKRLFPSVLLFAICVLTFGCPEAVEMISQAVQPPEVKMGKVQFSGISREFFDFDLGIVIDNPNPIGLPIAGIDYDFDLAGNDLASGTSDKRFELKASGKSETTIPVSIAYNRLKDIYEAAQGADEVPYSLSGIISVETPMGDIDVPYKTKGMLPIVRPPKIASVKVHIERMSLSGADLLLSMDIYNPNAFDLDIQGVDYNMTLDGRFFTSGRVDQKTIPEKSEGEIGIPVSMDFISAGQWGYSLLTKGSANYVLSYKGDYDIMGRLVEHNEEESGTVRFRR